MRNTTCDRCGTAYPSGTSTCRICQIGLSERSGPASGFPWISWIFIDLLLPWIGPAVTFFTASHRNDMTELAGVIAWPGVFFAVGAYAISQSEGSMRDKGLEEDGIRSCGRLARLALALLVFFEAAIVVAVSIYRWNPHERDIAIGIFKVCLVAFGVYAIASALSRLKRAKLSMSGASSR